MAKQATPKAPKQTRPTPAVGPIGAPQPAAGAFAALAATAVASPAPAAPTAPAVGHVVTRAQGTVQAVALGTKQYRVKAAHNAATWAAVQAALAAGPQPIAVVVQAASKHAFGGAVAMVGYLLRRGYLVAA